MAAVSPPAVELQLQWKLQTQAEETRGPKHKCPGEQRGSRLVRLGPSLRPWAAKRGGLRKTRSSEIEVHPDCTHSLSSSQSQPEKTVLCLDWGAGPPSRLWMGPSRHLYSRLPPTGQAAWRARRCCANLGSLGTATFGPFAVPHGYQQLELGGAGTPPISQLCPCLACVAACFSPLCPKDRLSLLRSRDAGAHALASLRYAPTHRISQAEPGRALTRGHRDIHLINFRHSQSTSSFGDERCCSGHHICTDGGEWTFYA